MAQHGRSHLSTPCCCLALAKTNQKSKGKEVWSRQATEVSLKDTGQAGEEQRGELKGHKMPLLVQHTPLALKTHRLMRPKDIGIIQISPTPPPQTLCLRNKADYP